MRETDLQIQCVRWIRQGYEVTGDERYNRWHHSANERMGGRAGLTAKLMGQSRGWPDLVHVGLRVAIEFKGIHGEVSKDQAGWLDYLKGLGWQIAIARSMPEFREKFCEMVGVKDWQETVRHKVSHRGTVT